MLPGPHLVVSGAKFACLDPGLSLRDPRCLVVSVRPPGDVSFDAGMRKLGCSVHSFESSPSQQRQRHARAPRQQPDLHHLPGDATEPISFLALPLTVTQLAELLHSPPEALSTRVEQFSARLELRDAWLRSTQLDRGDLIKAILSGNATEDILLGMPLPEPDISLLRSLYAGLLRLQELGFVPFSSSPIQQAGVSEVPVAGLDEPVISHLEVAWMKVVLPCDST